MTRRNVKFPDPLFEELNADRKDRDLKWPEYGRKLKDALDRADAIGDLESRIDALEERVDRVPSEAAAEVEGRLR